MKAHHPKISRIIPLLFRSIKSKSYPNICMHDTTPAEHSMSEFMCITYHDVDRPSCWRHSKELNMMSRLPFCSLSCRRKGEGISAIVWRRFCGISIAFMFLGSAGSCIALVLCIIFLEASFDKNSWNKIGLNII